MSTKREIKFMEFEAVEMFPGAQVAVTDDYATIYSENDPFLHLMTITETEEMVGNLPPMFKVRDIYGRTYIIEAHFIYRGEEDEVIFEGRMLINGCMKLACVWCFESHIRPE